MGISLVHATPRPWPRRPPSPTRPAGRAVSSGCVCRSTRRTTSPGARRRRGAGRCPRSPDRCRSGSTRFWATRSTSRAPVYHPVWSIGSSVFAAFQNPAFYSAQAMRRFTFGIPRIVACAELLSHHIALPRGCGEAMAGLLEDLGIPLDMRDERNPGRSVETGVSRKPDPGTAIRRRCTAAAPRPACSRRRPGSARRSSPRPSSPPAGPTRWCSSTAASSWNNGSRGLASVSRSPGHRNRANRRWQAQAGRHRRCRRPSRAWFARAKSTTSSPITDISWSTSATISPPSASRQSARRGEGEIRPGPVCDGHAPGRSPARSSSCSAVPSGSGPARRRRPGNGPFGHRAILRPTEFRLPAGMDAERPPIQHVLRPRWPRTRIATT